MVFRRWKDSYGREADYGDTALVDTNATGYLFGIVGETADHPTLNATLANRAPSVNKQEVDSGEMWIEILDGLGMYPVGMQNGILLQAVMGGSSTAGADPYTHTIGPPAAVDGVLPELPSFTIQHERYGSGAAWSSQFLGVKVAALLLTCGFEQKGLISRVDWIPRTQEKVAFQLTNTPDLPPTKNESTYKFVNMTRVWDSLDTALSLDGLEYMEFKISPEFGQERAATWDSGTWTGQYIRSLIESPLKKYELKFRYAPESSVIWEELTAATNGTKSMEFQWTRSANDYIKMTLTRCHVISHPLKSYRPGVSDLLEVTVIPEAVEFEVKDSIAASHYGE